MYLADSGATKPSESGTVNTTQGVVKTPSHSRNLTDKPRTQEILPWAQVEFLVDYVLAQGASR